MNIFSAIKSAEDLAKQTKVKYGAVVGGSTIKFFQNSKFSTFQQMWAAMEFNGEDVLKNLKALKSSATRSDKYSKIWDR